MICTAVVLHGLSHQHAVRHDHFVVPVLAPTMQSALAGITKRSSQSCFGEQRHIYVKIEPLCRARNHLSTSVEQHVGRDDLSSIGNFVNCRTG